MRNLGAEHANLDQKVHQILKNMIMDRQLLPGEKIPQEKIALELGVSRTPLIAALKYLEQEKLVESKPRRGFYVRLFSKEEMVSIFELREVLEGLTARRTAQKITDAEIEKMKRFFTQFDLEREITDFKAYSREDRRFHTFVTEIGAKEFLKSILETTNIISFSYQLITSEGLVRAPNETIHEHLAVIEAISRRDPTASEKLMRRHFKKTIAALTRDSKADEAA
ncbi:MAG: GntR family transcriptional regulator [Desulfobacterales bacterium]|nr:GntR family transcriptional regulator [Desulfobacterales bacterium]MDJ0991199.1 GntR family transcriptional regulator [Desulfobacterales bacterium]